MKLEIATKLLKVALADESPAKSHRACITARTISLRRVYRRIGFRVLRFFKRFAVGNLSCMGGHTTVVRE